MRLGLIARADDRGLGVLTWEFHRHLAPASTLVVREPGAEARGFLPHLDRYPGAAVVTYDQGTLPEQPTRDWLDGLDVVYSAETFYDQRLTGWAAAAGVATVLHTMPEFHSPAMATPTVLWAPTPWRLDQLPPARLVPVPVAADRFPLTAPARDGQLRVLHTAGHRAAADRNGTTALLTALRMVRQPMTVRLLTQDPHLPTIRPARGVTLQSEPGGRTDYWGLYADADVLALPRRYGGLCLPTQEAMAAGLAVVMADCPPNGWWPTLRVPASPRGELNTPCGPVPIYSTNPRGLARTLDSLALDGDVLAGHQAASVAWARAHTWEALAPLYQAELARAADRRQVVDPATERA